jgi:hypothetical protein
VGPCLNAYAATGCRGTDLSNMYCFCTSYNANDLSAALENNCPNANEFQCRSLVHCSCKVSRIVAKDDETDLILNSSQCGQHCAGLRPGSRTRPGQYPPTNLSPAGPNSYAYNYAYILMAVHRHSCCHVTKFRGTSRRRHNAPNR